MKKKVIITGVSGQAGSYFADYLLKNTDYEIYGMVRRLSVKNHKNIEHIKGDQRFHLFSGDLNDGHSLYKNIEEIKPDYFINCAAQSHVHESWNSPVNTFEVNTIALIHILEAIRKIVPKCKLMQFNTSEEMGDVVYTPQDEKHPARARSIYGAAKIATRQLIKVYRESYNLYCVAVWCFNYESSRRPPEFVTRKITQNIARIKKDLESGMPVITPLYLGALSPKRDWSYCPDTIDGVWRMLNQEQYNPALKDVKEEDLPKYIKEYVLASGETHSVKEFASLALKYANIDGRWIGAGLEEKFVDCKGRVIIEVSPEFFRPAEVNLLCGDSTLARKELGWQPKTSFEELVKLMVEHDIKEFSKSS